MTLKEYIKLNDLTNRAFAELANIDASLISRWISGAVCPSRQYYKKIFELTNGQVTPNDFFDLEKTSASN